MKSIELFAGIGGISLGAEWAGIETAAFCEIEPFCHKVLKKNWPGVPIFEDVKNLSKQSLIDRGVDVGAIELISGGWPCQPYSVAGKRKGDEDDRALWTEMFRIIEEIKPRWVVGENVANFTNMGIENTLDDLESIGYATQSFIIPAVAVGANHKRERLFVVGYSNNESKLQTDSKISTFRSERETRESASGKLRGELSRTHWENHQTPVCGMDDGTATRLDESRLKALGNAVVPQQIYPIFKAIVTIEKELA